MTAAQKKQAEERRAERPATKKVKPPVECKLCWTVGGHDPLCRYHPSKPQPASKAVRS